MKKIYVLPNIITMGNFLCGMYAMWLAMQGRLVLACYLVFVAMIFDFLDGKIARLTKTESAFGLQLDSLCDVVSFGVAPMVLVNLLFMRQYERVLWLPCVVFAACGALRLARYNIQTKTEGKVVYHGLPIPAAAGFITSFLLFCLYHRESRWLELIAPFMVAAAFLMVSRVKYPSFQRVNLNRRKSFETMIVFIIAAALTFQHFHILMLWSFAGYILVGIAYDIRSRIHRERNPLEDTAYEKRPPKKTSRP